MRQVARSPAEWTWKQVCAHRLDRRLLSGGSGAAAIPQVASAICGAHAQVMAAAELSIGLRTEGVTKGDVRQALWTDHSLIKTYGPRGTPAGWISSRPVPAATTRVRPGCGRPSTPNRAFLARSR
jgi:hypothetical protein